MASSLSQTFARPATVLAFVTAWATLFLQVLVHRMVSAKLLNNYAFLVISLTMLGFAFSGAILTRSRDRLLRDPARYFVTCAALLAASLLIVAMAFYRAPTGEHWAVSRSGFLLAFLTCVPFALLFTIPFTFAGLMLGALLSDPLLPTRRIYWYDLLGSAAGAFAVVPSITLVGVERAAMLACGVLLAATWLLCGRPRGRAASLAAAAAVLVAAAGIWPDPVFRMRYPAESYLGRTQQPGSGYVLEHVAWDPVARIELSRIPPPNPATFPWPALVGTHGPFLQRFSKVLTQNNNAYTFAVAYDGNPESLQGIDTTIYAAAYQAGSTPRPRVLVIGVGGGFDVLTALFFRASSVTGVEVNAATLGILTRTYADYFRPWVQDPRVSLVHDEGRHFLARSPQGYDVIQLSGVDSASGTPAAAHVFSENYLYSEEAFDLYLSRLNPRGLLNVMRPEMVPPREMLRGLATAVGALRRRGLTPPADHVRVLGSRNGLFTALLVKTSPFTVAEDARLYAWTAGHPFFGVVAPARGGRPRNAYAAFLELNDPARERTFTRVYPFDIRPVPDDRPFFFKFTYWSHLFPKDDVVRATIPVMEYSLLLLLLLTAGAGGLCVFLPLRQLGLGGVRPRHGIRYLVFFGGIGLGYMAVEVALLQKFGVFLGHPNYALSVVLAALLFFTGLGALGSAAVVRRLGRLRFVSYALAAVLLAEYFLAFPHLPGWVAWGFALRCVLVTALVAPLGLALGVFFPVGLEEVKRRDPPFVPWAWGVNGLFSVVAPLLAVALSITWGIDALLLTAIPVYLVASAALPGPLLGGGSGGQVDGSA